MTADEYLRQVEFALRDLPWGQRRDLIAELRRHLAELPPDTNLRERLGSPEQYAADLRAAAGLEQQHGFIAFIRAKRPRNVVVTVIVTTVVTVVVGLGIGALAWIKSYQPLDFGSTYRYPTHSVEVPGGATAVVVHEGRPFVLGFEIENRGRYAVRILGVPVDPYGSFTARVLMYPPTRYGGPTDTNAKPFRPFTLAPGHSVILVLRGVYRCRGGWKGSDGETSIDHLPVRYGFLWRKATANVPLPSELVFVYKKNISCPRAKR